MHYYPGFGLRGWMTRPVQEALDLLDELPTIEARRHLPMMQATDLMARWAMGDKAPPFSSWLPTFARDAESGVPAWVREDLKVGVDLRLASQELFDAVQELDA